MGHECFHDGQLDKAELNPFDTVVYSRYWLPAHLGARDVASGVPRHAPSHLVYVGNGTANTNI